ncbi:polysaccharide biosynthesis protein [Stieleria neptunia]|uniref:polysaccharide biosynthesis protein n=1 Tax=Stieleria neptunia TaxID=2527979 RepID=UPI0018D214E8|nr:nucleoside-diphosphate sugar epimerase/dehydratase [Stieleria neptunia]
MKDHPIVRYRLPLLVVAHTLLFAGTYALAFLLRFDLSIPDHYYIAFCVTMPVIVTLKTVIFLATGQLHGWWRIVSFRDLIGIVHACVISFLAIASAGYFSNSISIPRSVLLFDAIFTLLFVGGLRSAWRLFFEFIRPRLVADRYRPAALVGLDDETVFLASQIQSHGRLPLRIVGLISIDNTNVTRKSIGGFNVLGHLSALESVVRNHDLRKILVHTELLPGKVMRELMESCKHLGVDLRIVPQFEHRMSGASRIPTREIDIEDLLRREPARLDLENIRDLIQGNTILVTGAGGSIGSEICRQLIAFRPGRLVLLGRGENRIYHIEKELQAIAPATELATMIADIRDRERMEEVFGHYKPDVVFHAAAHKHVPLMERNIGEAIVNNVIGTCNVVDASHRYNVAKFVMISSDKAVRPTSVMGATKRVAEMYVSIISSQSSTQFMSVRFGNVLGSAGSVVPLFKKQIEQGGPITVTDERMTRFFMTIPEASQLVLQAASMGKGGELFVLDMGKPIKIVDLARDMVRLSGLPEDAIEIVFSGIRPGEKLYEELADAHGDIRRTAHEKIMSVDRSEQDESSVRGLIDFLSSPATSEQDAREALLSLDGTSNQSIESSFARPK